MPTHKKKGGKFLAEGTYGCVYSEAPTCVTPEMPINSGVAKPKSISKKSIAKIFNNKQDADEEWKKAQMIAEADPTQTYFIYATSRCDTTSKNVDKSDPNRKCSKIIRSSDEKYPMFKMPFGGDPLDTYVLSNPDITLKEFLYYMKQVFEALVLLKEHNLIHQDLKFNNILVYPDNKTISIIDIGLLIKSGDVLDPSKNEYLFSDYWLHPPEYRAVEWFLFSNIDKNDMFAKERDIVDVYFAHGDEKLGSLIDRIFVHGNYAKKYFEFVSRLQKVKVDDVRKHLQQYVNKIDVFSVGITMLYVTQYMPKFKTIFGDHPTYAEFLQKCLHPDPKERYDAPAALQHIETLITSLK